MVDLPEKVPAESADKETDKDGSVPTVPAWHGTLLPKTDADVWLAAAFAEYQKIVALEQALRTAGDGKLTSAERDRLAVEVFGYRASYLAAARSRP